MSSATAIRSLNENANVIRSGQAVQMNISAAQGLQEVLKSNLGPSGTLKMLVSGGGEIKMTKDGSILLREMQIQHPTAAMIARTATSQDDITGDGTTSVVVLIGELMKHANTYISEQTHPRHIGDGFEAAKKIVLEELDKFAVSIDPTNRDILMQVSQTALRTKVEPDLADALAEYCVEAVLTIHRPEKPIDLHMVEIMTMVHRDSHETRLVRGLVLDHGARHPGMYKGRNVLHNVFILTCNVSFEYEKTEMNSSMFYKSAEEKERIIKGEHEFIDSHVQKVIDLKNKVCVGDKKDYGFVVINMKGIDPPALEMFSNAGIVALRRAKRRNMERLVLACGGASMNSVEDLTAECLGFAGTVYEQTLGEEKFTFVEDVPNPFSVTLLVKGANDHSVNQQKDAIRDGLRAVANVFVDKKLVPGAGSFFLHASETLLRQTIEGEKQFGVRAFADALVVIPKTLGQNAGLSMQEVIVGLKDEYARQKKEKEIPVVGVNLTGDDRKALNPQTEGIWDNYRVIRQMLHATSIIASQMLLVDEMISAGRGMKKGQGQ